MVGGVACGDIARRTCKQDIAAGGALEFVAGMAVFVLG